LAANAELLEDLIIAEEFSDHDLILK
jgi:hypothetical protein